MAQLTVYVEDKVLKRIDRAAKRERISISKWVNARLANALQTTWPGRYFNLIGSLSKERLARPKQPGFKNDIRRGAF